MATLSLFADVSKLSDIREFSTEAARDLGLDEQGVFALELAVDEACSNVIRHGYGGRGGPLEVQIEPGEGGVQVIIRDWGSAFDPGAVPVPDLTLPLEGRPLGGLGLFLMRQLMDKVDFQFDAQRGNKLTMLKRYEGGNHADEYHDL